jgi:predicted Zn-ribbon and HTH transcriptional regulator
VTDLVTCHHCKGSKVMLAHFHTEDPSTHGIRNGPCFACRGTGEQPPQKKEWEALGAELREIRLAQEGMTLGRLSRIANCTTVVVSESERGVIDPGPVREALKKYLSAPCRKCGYESGDDWTQCKGFCPKPWSPHYQKKADIYYNITKTLTIEEKAQRLASLGGDYRNVLFLLKSWEPPAELMESKKKTEDDEDGVLF